MHGILFGSHKLSPRTIIGFHKSLKKTSIIIASKLFNQMVIGKQAFVIIYAWFQTTASPRPFDYEYKNIRLLS